ncbi:MAG: histidinol-phosphatase HisJ family protein [Peptococcaceae bacterium]
MLIDYHLHSQFSCDSLTNMESICQTAVAAGLDEIAFTDHMDLTWPQQYENHYIHDLDNYLAAIAQYQTRYAGQLTIRAGVEIGLERHRLQEYQNILTQYPLDFVIGSIHEIGGIAVSQKAFFQGKSKKQVYRQYYSAILDCIRQFDNFDVIGHLDYCKRYAPFAYEPGDHLIAMDLITEILQELIQRGKGIEVNTSGYRHASAMCLPHFDILRHYHQLGGTRITIGSDSHRTQYVGYRVAETTAVLKTLGFTHISTFGHRKEKQVAL